MTDFYEWYFRVDNDWIRTLARNLTWIYAVTHP